MEASQVILTNTMFFLQEQLEELEKENTKLKIENAKLKSKLESIENYAEELGEEIYKQEVTK